MSNLYENIKKRRIQLGLSQQELAKRMGYTSRSSIAKIEVGRNDIPQSKIEAFAKALQTTPAYLMGWESAGRTPLQLTGHEENLIAAYRTKPEMQPAIDQLLGI